LTSLDKTTWDAKQKSNPELLKADFLLPSIQVLKLAIFKYE
jgi:hypothetical protein